MQVEKMPLMNRAGILAEIRAKLAEEGSNRGPRGNNAAARLARICRVTVQASATWLRDGIPPERVELVSALTGIPPQVIRPDRFAPRVGASE
jgi:hypothetical protein